MKLLKIIIILLFFIIFLLIINNQKNHIIDNFISKINKESIILNGINYGNTVQQTPCLNKSDDFDSWCKYYQNTQIIPEGMNRNSIGVKKILIGSDGECYLNETEKISDPNSARALCNFNYIEEVQKLDPLLENSSYNVFTDCYKLDSHKNENIFKKECNELLGTKKIEVEQITGYDCNPGYGRAKCLKKIDYNKYEKENIIEENEKENIFYEEGINNIFHQEEEKEEKYNLNNIRNKSFDFINKL